MVGGAVAALLGLLPVSPATGGAVAGYRQATHVRSVTPAGAIAGVVGLPHGMVVGYLALPPAFHFLAVDVGAPASVLVRGGFVAATISAVGPGSLAPSSGSTSNSPRDLGRVLAPEPASIGSKHSRASA